jgi:hypothetical protein
VEGYCIGEVKKLLPFAFRERSQHIILQHPGENCHKMQNGVPNIIHYFALAKSGP